MSISFFAKRSFRARSDGHLQRVSSIIRGQQIADRLHAKLNPTDGYKNDICIYVKPHVKSHEDFDFEGKAFLDIIDGWGLLSLANKHPDVSIITCSAVDFEYVSENTKNKVVLIPQHHCNFERLKRERKTVTVVGCIGTPGAFDFLPENLREKLKERNIELKEFSHFRGRQDILSFYQSIDVQIVWRPYMKKMKIRMSNPLKLVNAASFGIPTIALDEPAFGELSGAYLPVNTLEEFFFALDTLRESATLYNDYAKKCLEKSQRYHIDNVAQLYNALT